MTENYQINASDLAKMGIKPIDMEPLAKQARDAERRGTEWLERRGLADDEQARFQWTEDMRFTCDIVKRPEGESAILYIDRPVGSVYVLESR